MDEHKTTWNAFVTARLAPAAAGVFVERIFSNDLVSAMSDLLVLTIQDVRSAILFLAIMAFTDPMFYVRALKTCIIAVRTFWASAKQQITEAFNKPINNDGEENK